MYVPSLCFEQSHAPTEASREASICTALERAAVIANVASESFSIFQMIKQSKAEALLNQKSFTEFFRHIPFFI